ncbi:MAG: DinB family protein [Alphaproteobacteria bacterium]
MITPGYVQQMSVYNRWMNDGIFGACDQLSDDDRKKNCGAFFKSIHGTFNHLLWADQIWMHRFAATPAPQSEGIPGSVSQYASYNDLKRERAAFDQVIDAWATDIDPGSLEGELTWYSGIAGREITKPRWLLITHMFNHQTHHRGQVHCLLTRFGVETPTTDLPLMP